MSFPIAIKAELLKTKRTSVVYVAMIASFISPLLMFFFTGEEADSMKVLAQDPWNDYFKGGFQFLHIVFLPLYVILITSLIPQLEHRHNAWKQVLTSPQSKFNIYFSKFFVIQLLILFYLLLHNIYTTLSLIGVDAVRHDLKLSSHTLNWKWFLAKNGNAYMSVFAISAFQFWLGVRFRNFIIPLAIGVGLWMSTLLLVGAYNWDQGDKIFFAFPSMMVTSKYKTLDFVIMSSLAYGVFFSLIGFLDFAKRKRKGI